MMHLLPMTILAIMKPASNAENSDIFTSIVTYTSALPALRLLLAIYRPIALLNDVPLPNKHHLHCPLAEDPLVISNAPPVWLLLNPTLYLISLRLIEATPLSQFTSMTE